MAVGSVGKVEVTCNNIIINELHYSTIKLILTRELTDIPPHAQQDYLQRNGALHNCKKFFIANLVDWHVSALRLNKLN